MSLFVRYVPNGIGSGGGGAGTVTSVGLSDASSTPIFTVTGSPVTSSGTLTLTLKTETANTVFAGPTTGVAAQPTFRALVAADLPAGTGTVTTVSVVSANGLAGSVANPTTTPALTLSTTITGILQGNGTAISAASTTGTGNVVLSDSPTLTGTIGAASMTLSGTLVATGAISGSNLTAGGHALIDIPNSLVTNTGDLIYASSASTPARLGIGSTNDILTVIGGVPVWQAPATSGTVTSVAMTVPAFLSIAGSPVTSSGTLAVSLSGTALPIANGGTGVTSVTTTPVASSFVGWNAQRNVQAVNFIPGSTSTVTAAGTTTLTVGANYSQVFTGSTTQTVVLPTTSVLKGQQYVIINTSSGAVTVQSSNLSQIVALAANTQCVVNALLATPVAPTDWAAVYTPINSSSFGTVTSVALSVPGTSILGVTGSPITTSGTLALTTTGTSGGIPYFSSTSQLASSALLAQYSVVLGGGAGATPATLATDASTTKVLKSGGSSANPSWSAITPAMLSSQGTVTAFTASGTFTTPSTSSSSTIYSYTVLGAGGGGGGTNGATASGGGGGAGGYSTGTFTGIAASTGVTITIGAGGTAGANTGGNGGVGGTTSIGSPVSVSCVGGSGGVGSTSIGASGGGGGTASGGAVNLTGVAGQNSTASTPGGIGGGSSLGGGGSGGAFGVVGAGNTGSYGAGGGGGVGSSAAGGAGGQGFVIITQLTP